MGATASLYAVLACTAAASSEPPSSSQRALAHSTLSEQQAGHLALLAELADVRLHARLRSRTCAHTWLIRTAASRMVLGVLKHARVPNARTPLVAASLAHVLQVLRGLALFQRDTLRCARLFELVADDLFLTLAALRPYTVAHVHSALKAVPHHI